MRRIDSFTTTLPDLSTVQPNSKEQPLSIGRGVTPCVTSVQHCRPISSNHLRGFFHNDALHAGTRASRSSIAAAATATAATPEALAQLVLQRFCYRIAEEFDSVDPDPSGRGVSQPRSIEKRFANPTSARWSGAIRDRAVLLLTGTVVDKDSAVETIRSRHFSGLYEAVKSANSWAISRQLPFDADNRHYLSHHRRNDIARTQHRCQGHCEGSLQGAVWFCCAVERSGAVTERKSG